MAWYHLAQQAKGYLINVNLSWCALTERKPRGMSPSAPSPLYHGGGMS